MARFYFWLARASAINMGIDGLDADGKLGNWPVKEKSAMGGRFTRPLLLSAGCCCWQRAKWKRCPWHRRSRPRREQDFHPAMDDWELAFLWRPVTPLFCRYTTAATGDGRTFKMFQSCWRSWPLFALSASMGETWRCDSRLFTFFPRHRRPKDALHVGCVCLCLIHFGADQQAFSFRELTRERQVPELDLIETRNAGHSNCPFCEC